MQVHRVQKLLSDILILDPDEAREDVIPVIYLHRLRDNPAVVENGWNFLQDDRNKTFLPCKNGWLLRRVLQNDRLGLPILAKLETWCRISKLCASIANRLTPFWNDFCCRSISHRNNLLVARRLRVCNTRTLRSTETSSSRMA